MINPMVVAELADTFLKTREHFGGDVTTDLADDIVIDSAEQAGAFKAILMRSDMAAVAACDFSRGVASDLADQGLVFSAFSLARSCLESSLTAIWLLEAGTSLPERIGRFFDLRFDELNEGRKLAAVLNNQEMTDLMNGLVEELHRQAIDLGVKERIAKRTGRRIGYGDDPMTLTGLCERYLGTEAPYRFLSSVTHGASWALRRAGMIDGPPQPLFGVPMLVLERPSAADEMLINITSQSLVPAVDLVVRSHGWDSQGFRNQVEKILERHKMWVDWNTVGEPSIGHDSDSNEEAPEVDVSSSLASGSPLARESDEL